MYCQMTGTMEEEPTLFVCQCCQSAFCKTCFIEQLGEEEYQDITGNEDREILCPRCQSKRRI